MDLSWIGFRVGQLSGSHVDVRLHGARAYHSSMPGMRSCCALALLACAKALSTPCAAAPAPAAARVEGSRAPGVAQRRAMLAWPAALVAFASGASAAPMIDYKKRARSTEGEEEEDSPSYLTEPTAEFKEAEVARAAFRKKQAAYKAQFDVVFSTFKVRLSRAGAGPNALEQVAENDEALAAALVDVRKIILNEGGLPSGLRLTDFITLCRRVKGAAVQRGGWGTPVEIEYQNLIRGIKAAENPNLQAEGYL
ncbi:hypothetical protein M885DRAFT_618985 [Pelagophyceae sp. CCMP2097]|nr:hypothetical protein M885DRAFT_618985 [Pelagophyceae sp. CCMP2097]